MIKVDRLVKRFGQNVAVNNVSFSVNRGEVLAFLGPNGAGKSTTMKMITGFLTPCDGKVEIDGVDMAMHPDLAKSTIGYLPEGIPLYEDMPVHSFLAFAGKVRGLSKQELAKGLSTVVSALQLEDVFTQAIGTLSKGYQRRVGLAQALLHDPDYLVLDEPTDGLDPNQKVQIHKLIREISENKAIILSTHILEEVDAVCNQAIIIHKGRIVVEGTPEELIAQSDIHNSVLVEFDGELPEDAPAKLKSIQRASRIEKTKDGRGVRIFSGNRDSILDDVNQLVRSCGWQVRIIGESRGTLDEVFRKLTQS